MKKNKSIITMLFFIALASCHTTDTDKPNNSNEVSKMDLLKNFKPLSREKYNFVDIFGSVIDGEFNGGSTSHYYKKVDETGAKINPPSDDLFINNENLSTSSNFYRGVGDDEYTKTFYCGFSKEAMDVFKAQFGHTVSFSSSVLKKGGKVTEITVYCPKLVNVTNRENLHYFSTRKDLTITWEVDANNDEPISITLILRTIGKEQKPAGNVHINKIVKDVGSFTISSNELSIFPEESQVDIRMDRGNKEVIDDNVFALYNTALITAHTIKESE